MEQFCVMVDGHLRTVCGVTLETTCDELVCALCRATGKRYDDVSYRIYEVWRTFERLVGLDESLLELRAEWGDYESDVTFVMKIRKEIHAPLGLCLPHVNASRLTRRGYRQGLRNSISKVLPCKLQIKKLRVQEGKLKNQTCEIRSLERELAFLQDAVDRLHLTDEEQRDLFDLRAVFAKQQNELEELRLWEQQLDVQTKEKETYDREIERLKDDVGMKQKELTRYQEDEKRLLAEVKASARKYRSLERIAGEMEIDMKLKQLKDELEERMKANAKEAVKMKEARLALEETERSIQERQRYIEYLNKQISDNKSGQTLNREESNSSASDVVTVNSNSLDTGSDHDSLVSFFESSSWENDEGSYV